MRFIGSTGTEVTGTADSITIVAFNSNPTNSQWNKKGLFGVYE